MKYNGSHWEELPQEGKEAATKLGYSQELWDADKVPESCNQYWEDLDKNQQQGAEEMGYDEHSWNNLKATRRRSMYLLYLSHLCFVLGSLFYFQLSMVSIRWDQYTRDHRVPQSVLDEDDDDTWEEWSYENNHSDILEVREDYWVQYERNNVLGAFSYAAMGFIEMCSNRNGYTLHNLLMPLGGLLGMINALQYDGSAMQYGSAVSLTFYLLSCTRLDFFFVGSALECIVSYAYLAGFDGAWLLYLDSIACLLWLYCAVVGVASEYGFSFEQFLRKERAISTPCSPLSCAQQKTDRYRH